MKNLGQILFIVLIIVVVFAIIYSWTKKQLSALALRLIIVEQEIATALKNLRLTEELKSRLDRRVKLIFFGLKMLCCLLLAAIWIYLINSGNALINSMLDTFNIVGLGYVLVSLLVFNKLTDTNVLISIIKKQIQVWVYRRAKFDPERIPEIQSGIRYKMDEASELREQLGTGHSL
jgi:hypothetical protein